MKIRVGTRGSELALTQSRWVCEALMKHSDVTCELVVIKTKGDQIQDKSLEKIGDKGLFVTEIERALMEGQVDIAVHSMKDMPSTCDPSLSFSKTPKRADRRDVLVLAEGLNGIDDIPLNGLIGTGSKRRLCQMKAIRPDLTFQGIRGNVGTRVKKVASEGLSGTILAAAGLHRLGLEYVIDVYLDEVDFIPAPAQGALGIQYRTNDQDLATLLDKIGDDQSHLEVVAERSFMKYVNGSCHVPMGAYALIKGNQMCLTGYFGREDGSLTVRDSITGPADQGEMLGKALAKKIMEALDER